MKPDQATETAAPAVLHVGRQFSVYRVEALLGAGGMGQVFRGVDTRLNRPVAIKVCSARFGERFDREALAISAFNHPHICTLYNIGPDYLVMELIDGDTLAARIRKGPLPVEEVLRYGAQIADALDEAHRAGIVHRDLKPGSVMISRHGVKVLDFGLAKMTETLEPTITQASAVLGTPAYMAPEQIAGRDAGARADLFALGLVLYEMTTGQLPMPGASLGRVMLGDAHTGVTAPSKLRAEVSSLDDLIARLLNADPLQRPASAAAVATELRALAAPKSQGMRRGVIAGVAAMAVIAIGASWWLTRGARGPARFEVASITPITNLAGNKLDPAYSPDGSAIAFSWRGQDGKSPGIYVLDGDAQVPRRLTQSGLDDVAPAWSRDGAKIAFERLKTTGAHELIVIQATGGPELKIRDVTQSLPLASTTRPLLTWTPDGSAIVIPTLDVDAGGRASLFRIGLKGEPPQRLRELRLDAEGRHAEGPAAEFMPRGSIGGPRFSPDGRWLTFANFPGLWIATAAFHKVDELFAPLYVVDLDANGAAGAVRKVAQTKSFGLVGASWSADGNYLYTTAINKTPQRVMRARVSDGELEDLFDGALPVVAADGRRVFYRKGLVASPLFARSLEGDIAGNTEEQLVPGCVMVFGIVATPRGIYYVACNEQTNPVALRYFEFSSRRSHDLGPPPLGAQPMLTVSADGRRLVYSTALPNNGELTRVTLRVAEQ